MSNTQSNKLYTLWLSGRDRVTAIAADQPTAGDDDLLGQILESANGEVTTSRERGKLATTCGQVIYMTNPRTGIPKKVEMKCGNCFSCRMEKSREIWRGLKSKETWHSGYAFKICDDKEAKRMIDTIHKDNLIRLPIGEDSNLLVMSRRALAMHHEPITKSQAVESLDEIEYSEFLETLAMILGDRPLEKRSSGQLHKHTAAEAFDAFQEDDEDYDIEAAMDYDDLIEGSQEITYYGISIKTNAPISILKIGAAAQLQALEETIDDIPQTLEEVQRVLNRRKDIFVNAITYIAEMTGLDVEVRIKHFTTEMLPSEIAWSENLNREAAQKLRHNMNYFSDQTQVEHFSQPEDDLMALPT